MRDFGRSTVWQSKVNTFLALLCVGCVTLGAWLTIWHAAFGENPLANAMAAQINADLSY